MVPSEEVSETRLRLVPYHPIHLIRFVNDIFYRKIENYVFLRIHQLPIIRPEGRVPPPPSPCQAAYPLQLQQGLDRGIPGLPDQAPAAVP